MHTQLIDLDKRASCVGWRDTEHNDRAQAVGGCSRFVQVMDDPSVKRVDQLHIERLRVTSDRKEKDPDEPSTSGLSTLQQPVILDADRVHYPNEEEGSPFQDCQVDGLLRIFEILTIKERSKLSQTCRRFHQLLTDKNCSSIKGLTVLNMFQKRVWVKSVRNNAISSLTMLNISSVESIASLLQHVRRIDCLKIWYLDTEFVNLVLGAFDDSIQIRSVDVFPYGTEIALAKVDEVFPKIRSITMRPHGSSFFYKGLSISSMPNFSNLSVLSMDSFDPEEGFVFPSSVKSLDFAHRRLRNIRYLFYSLQQLTNLSYLSLCHLKFPFYIEELIHEFSMMRRLEALVLRFCHLSAECEGMATPDERKLRQDDAQKNDRRVNVPALPPLSLRQLHFDLCYDVTWSTMRAFTACSQASMKNLSVSLLYEDRDHFEAILMLSPMLHSLKVTLSFTVMQKDTRPEDEIKPPPPLPDDFRHVVSRFEASYLVQDNLLFSMFDLPCKNLQEAKFICSKGLTDDVLDVMAKNCPHLKKLSIVSCGNASEEGLLAFATNIASRKTTAPLEILYKNTRSMCLVYGELLARSTKHQTIYFTTKTFPEVETIGERLFFKDQQLNRSVIYKNYTVEDSNHLLGLVIDLEDELDKMNIQKWSSTFPMDHPDEK